MSNNQRSKMNILALIMLIYYMTRYHPCVMCYTVTCDFELDECGWTLDPIWVIQPSGSSPVTASSGPTADHTTGTGNYARFLGAFLTEFNLFGTMNATISLDTPTPFSFWYFMHGNQIGTLALLVDGNLVWEKSRRQGLPMWYQANVTLPVGINVNIMFAANRTGTGQSSDIALDDILLENEFIPSTRSTKTRPTTTQRTRINASCDFDVEMGTCGWRSDAKYSWQVVRERRTNITMGPSSDYSSIKRPNNDGKVCLIPYNENGDQYYCTISSGSLKCKVDNRNWIVCRDGWFLQIFTGQFDQVGERSQFRSPVLEAKSEEGCIQFQYNIVGTDDDWLNVYVEDWWTERSTCMWHKNGSIVPDQWMTGEVPLELEQDGRYQIVFEAGKGISSIMGIVSLDHIIISGARCSGAFLVQQCPREAESTTEKTTADSQATTMHTTRTIITSIQIETELKTTFTSSLTNSNIVTSSSEKTVSLSIEITSTTPEEEKEVSSKPPSNPPVVAIVLGVVGGAVVVSSLLALFLGRHQLQMLFHLKQSNRVSITPTFKKTPDPTEGAVRFDVTRDQAPAEA